MLTGGCHCAAIRYEIDAEPASRTICHCTMCRGTTGAPCVAWFTVPKAAWRLKGSPTEYRSSAHATRYFCSVCGTQVAFADDALPNEIDVSTCTLDDPSLAAPTAHIFTDSQVAWLQLGDKLMRYARSRADE